MGMGQYEKFGKDFSIEEWAKELASDGWTHHVNREENAYGIRSTKGDIEITYFDYLPGHPVYEEDVDDSRITISGARVWVDRTEVLPAEYVDLPPKFWDIESHN